MDQEIAHSLQDSWQRIASWHEKNCPAGTFRLATGASETQIAALETRIGHTLPRDLRASFMLHDGTAGTWLLFYGELMPLAGIEQDWKRYCDLQQKKGYGIGEDWETREIEGPIKPIFWNPMRIPITDNGGGDPVMVDLDPPERGHWGQVIKHNHEVGPQHVLAPSFQSWLSDMATALEAGKYVFIEEAGTVAPPGMWD